MTGRRTAAGTCALPRRSGWHSGEAVEAKGGGGRCGSCVSCGWVGPCRWRWPCCWRPPCSPRRGRTAPTSRSSAAHRLQAAGIFRLRHRRQSEPGRDVLVLVSDGPLSLRRRCRAVQRAQPQRVPGCRQALTGLMYYDACNLIRARPAWRRACRHPRLLPRRSHRRLQSRRPRGSARRSNGSAAHAQGRQAAAGHPARLGYDQPHLQIEINGQQLWATDITWRPKRIAFAFLDNDGARCELEPNGNGAFVGTCVEPKAGKAGCASAWPRTEPSGHSGSGTGTSKPLRITETRQ